jgi:branched-chain amino acid transport system substrate-binding protein
MAENTGTGDAGIARRDLLRAAGLGAATLGGGGLLAACSSGIKGAGGSSSSGTGAITIGFVHPLTGPLAGFGSGDNFVLDQVRSSAAYAKGFKVGGKTYNVNVISQDTQSDANRASQVTRQLILQNNADMIVTTSTPETVNPVASVCQAEGVPCACTNIPWEPWYINLGGNPAQPTKAIQYVTMFFFGVEHLAQCFIPMWNRISNNKVAACMFPNDSDGNAFRAAWPLLVKGTGYTLVNPPAYTDGTTNYTSMISEFKSRNCELYTNVPLPPDFNTMWRQSAQQGWKPKLATVAKVLLFPADTVALGPLVKNIATDSWWGPWLPYSSSLNGISAQALANLFETTTGNQWVQSIGGSYSLFEVAREAFLAVDDPHDKKAVAAALHKVNYTGISGPINFSTGPAPGVAITPPVGVQWQTGTKYPFELQVVDNTLNKNAKITADLQPTNA